MDIGFLIDGEERKSLNGAVYERHDPFTGKVATRAAAAGIADAKAAVDAAAAAFKSWSKTTPVERRTLLMKAADIMESKVGEFTRLLIEETLPIEKELYLGIVIDRAEARPVFMASAAGGMEIEQVAAENPAALSLDFSVFSAPAMRYETVCCGIARAWLISSWLQPPAKCRATS